MRHKYAPSPGWLRGHAVLALLQRAARAQRRHIGEIAFAWGFNDLSHFGRVFREHFGMSPRDWRHSKMPN